MIISTAFASEFDILKGCVIKTSVPEKQNYNEGILSSYMIPDGVHKYEYDYSIFRYEFINEEVFKLIEQINQLPATKLELYKKNNDSQSEWEQQKVDEFSITIDSFPFVLNLKKNKIPAFQFNYHKNMELVIKQEERQILLINEEKQHFMIKISESSQYEIEKLKQCFDLIKNLELQDKVFEEYYFFNLVKNTKDNSLKRGLLTRSIAICSNQIQVMWFLQPVLKHFIQQYSMIPVDPNNSHKNEIDAILNHVLKACNQCINQVPQKFLKFEKDRKMIYKHFQLENDESFIKDISYDIEDPQTKEPQKLICPVQLNSLYYNNIINTGSLIDFLHVFKEKTMIIYNGLLQGKKILFIGYERPIKDSLQFVSTCYLLLQPLNTIFQLYPYEHLLNLKFTTHETYIAAVSNPIFNSREEWFDISADITTGQVIRKGQNGAQKNKKIDEIMEEKMEIVDNQFIKEVLQEIKNGNLNEDNIRSYFYRHTTTFIDLVMNMANELDFEKEDKSLNDAFQRRISKFSQTYLYQDIIEYQGNLYTKENKILDKEKYRDLYAVANTIRTEKILTNQQLLKFYSQLLKICDDENVFYSILRVLYEKWGKIDLIGMGLYSQDSEIIDLTYNLFQQLDKTQFGENIVKKKLNFIIQCCYQNLKNKKQKEDGKKQVDE